MLDCLGDADWCRNNIYCQATLRGSVISQSGGLFGNHCVSFFHYYGAVKRRKKSKGIRESRYQGKTPFAQEQHLFAAPCKKELFNI